MYGLSNSNSTLAHYYANYTLHYKALESNLLLPTKNERPLDSSSNVCDHEALSGTFSATSDTPQALCLSNNRQNFLTS